jgi:hypothetical protein
MMIEALIEKLENNPHEFFYIDSSGNINILPTWRFLPLLQDSVRSNRLEVAIECAKRKIMFDKLKEALNAR